MPPRTRTPIGWREWTLLPELGGIWVKAKVDTGARSSTLHAFDVALSTRRGKERVSFKVHPLQRNTSQAIQVEADVIEWRTITSSSGHRERRPVVQTLLELCGDRWPIELTLTNRDAMGFRMLLGRQAIRRRFVVDPGRSYLGGRPPKLHDGARKRRKKRE